MTGDAMRTTMTATGRPCRPPARRADPGAGPPRPRGLREPAVPRARRRPLRRSLAAAHPPSLPTTGQLEIALESQLTPREIQARVRAGHSLDEVAIAAGISADRVERYAAPVHRRACATSSSRPSGARPAGYRRQGSGAGRARRARLAEQRVAPDRASGTRGAPTTTAGPSGSSYLAGGRRASRPGPSTRAAGCSPPPTRRPAGWSTTPAPSGSPTSRRPPFAG